VCGVVTCWGSKGGEVRKVDERRPARGAGEQRQEGTSWPQLPGALKNAA
jgi:hypothetical protein